MTTRWTPVYVALGSNLADPLSQVKTAIDRLRACEGFQSVIASTAVESAPVGFVDQPKFINAVVGFLTRHSLTECHNLLKSIETQMGKIPPTERFGPRVIDLDVLLFGSVTSDDPSLLLPHPRLHERVFVLYPLSTIAPSVRVRDGRSVTEWLAGLPASDWEGFADLGVSL